ncbi:mitochondrial inner membrane protein Mitofilin [Abortiporus biennis]|nr:mitochondrial inner membrane protein Mitofilin [Abortiporus biennis]
MFRSLSAVRAVRAPVGRSTLRATTRRYATETSAQPIAPVPKKKKKILRRFIFYSAAATTTFYVGSAFVAFKSPQYYELFIEKVPLGGAFIQYAEDHSWDTLTVAKVVRYGQDTIAYVQKLAKGEEKNPAVEKAKEATESVRETALEVYETSKERLLSIAQSLKTKVSRDDSAIYDKGLKAGAIAKHRSEELSEVVEELVEKAEQSIAEENKTESLPEATTTPAQLEVLPDTAPPRHNEDEVTVFISTETAVPSETPAATEEPLPAVKGKEVYDAPLPLGFEPPPGYARPAPPKPAPKATSSEAAAAAVPVPLPLVAPVVAEFEASEPVLTQLASVIDNLASYVNSDPTAADKARDILENAKGDLTQLATRIDQVKQEERSKLEATLDEQTREYTLKLLELEMEAQDKLDNQEEGFKKFFEDEKARFIAAYREKLNRELETQSEIINERLKEEVVAQGIELQRRWIREIKVRVEQERGGRLAKLDELSTGLKRLERIALDNSAYLDENLRIHALWSALRALDHAVDSSERTPFRDELRVLRHIALAREDPVVTSVLDTLESSTIPDIGVEPFADLASWFSTSVAPKVSTVALVPDQNAGLLSHLASHLFSSFRFKRHGLVEGDDVLSVLARAEYYMNEKDLDSAARELNQLKGTAKVMLSDWLEAARKRLEVLQALEVMQTQATLASLLVAQD